MKYILSTKWLIAMVMLLTMACFTSCKKWLTVHPNTEAEREELFSNERGFQDALTGVYLNMKHENAYGKNMTFGTIEFLASSWDVRSNTLEQRLGYFQYEDADVQSALGNMYAQTYRTIAMINSILEKIDSQKGVFSTPGAYEMIKGECLGLRAYCHLDLLRLFGPVPGNATAARLIPYAKKLSKDPLPYMTYQEFKTELLQDLEEAAALQHVVDPILQYSLKELVVTDGSGPFKPENTYFSYRFLRLNYYAVKALQARTYLWFGDTDAAYACAREVIEAKNRDGGQKFVLGKMSDMSNGDLTLSVEHIFGLYDFGLKKKFTDNFENGNLKKGTSAATVNAGLYGNTGTDIREINLWNLITLGNNTKAYILKKYAAASSEDKAGPFQIPMIRVSEMYLICAETAAGNEKQKYWDAFLSSRGLTSTALPADPVLLRNTVLKEYRKEFFAEGQGFFAYKRLNTPKELFLWCPPAATVVYQAKVPNNEFVNN